MKVFLCLQCDFAEIATKSEILVSPVSWEVFFVIANDLTKKPLAKPAPVPHKASASCEVN